MSTSELLPIAHLALSAVFLLWNVLLAGRITGQRALPPLLAGLTALGGLLVVPALLVLVASTSLDTGRLVSTIGWIWPVTATLIAAQAFYATAARLVSPLVGIPILIYDVVAAGTALASYLVAQGETTSGSLLTLVAASSSALATVAGAGAALSPLHVAVPLLSPAHPSRWRVVAGWRVAVALIAGAWAALVIVGLRNGRRALAGYQPLASAELRLRPDEAFTVGLEILPALSAPPVALNLRNDLELVGDGELGAVLVTIARGGARNLALDSLRRALEPYRRDSLLLLVGVPPIGMRDGQDASASAEYVAMITRVVSRLRPEYLVVLEEDDAPDSRPRGASVASRREWQIRALVSVAKAGTPRAKVALSVVPGARDSALYAWAMSGDSPLDAVGFSLLADAGGGSRLAARMRTAERWMARSGPAMEHWVFRAGAAPTVHGDVAQDHALTGLLGWAMGRPGIRGVIVTHAGDYGSMRGLRSPTGRIRPAAATLFRAGKEAR
jgi:hypothetical protein